MKKNILIFFSVWVCLSCEKIDVNPVDPNLLASWERYADLQCTPDDAFFGFVANEEFVPTFDSLLASGMLSESANRSLLMGHTSLLEQAREGDPVWCLAWIDLLSIYDTVSFDKGKSFLASREVYPFLWEKIKKLPHDDTSAVITWRFWASVVESDSLFACQLVPSLDTSLVLSHEITWHYYDHPDEWSPLYRFLAEGNPLDYDGVADSLQQAEFILPLCTQAELDLYKIELRSRLSGESFDPGGLLLFGIHRWFFLRRNGLATLFPKKLSLPSL